MTDKPTLIAPKAQGIARVGEQQRVCLLSQQQGRLRLKAKLALQAIDLPLTQDKLQPTRYCSWFWPTQSGWHLLEYSDDNHFITSQWRYVYQKERWQTQDQYQRLKATEAFMVDNQTNTPYMAPTSYQQINSWWYWWLLLLSAGFLWFERRGRF